MYSASKLKLSEPHQNHSLGLAPEQKASFLDKSRAMQIGVGLRSLKMNSEIILEYLRAFEVPRKLVESPRVSWKVAVLPKDRSLHGRAELSARDTDACHEI